MRTKLIFKVAVLEKYIETIQDFLKEDSPLRKIILQVYPELEKALEKKNSEKTIRTFFERKEKELGKYLPQIRGECQDEWNKHEKTIIKKLEELHETTFPEKKYVARITINPICPRYLDKAMFDLYFAMHTRTALTICIHELSHFLFFNKIKEIMPKIKPKEYEAPHLMWKLSEMIPGILLDEKTFEKFEPQTDQLVYETIQKLIVEGRPILDTLKEFYKKRKNFEEFVKKAYKYLQEHKEELEI